MFKKLSDIDMYAKSDAKAKRNWYKYKKTGKTKYRDKANYDYAKKEALGIKLSHPSKQVTKTSVSEKDSFNRTKSTNIKVPLKINSRSLKILK